MKKFSISKLFANRTFCVIFSIAVAIVCWLVVVFSVSTVSTRDIEGVPVSFKTNSSVYQSIGLDIMDSQEFMATVRITGERGRIGALDSASIVVTPIVTGVTAAGEYDLELVATKTNTMDTFSIVSIVPSHIKVRFDTAVSKKLPVTPNVSGITVDDGFMIGKIASSPAEVTITGPADIISSVSAVSAPMEADTKLDKTTTYQCGLKLFGEGGDEVPLDRVKLDVKTVDVTIPVYMRGKMKLGVEFTNVPEGFDLSALDYVMSHTEIPVAASASKIETVTAKTIGYIDLATFKLGESYTFDVTLPTGFVNLDNISTVTVTFPQTDIASKRINVTDIRLQNEPVNYSVTVATGRINDVTVIGPKDEVEALLPGSVIALVDMSGISVESGVYNVPVSFKVTGSARTWAAGSYTVTIEVKPD